MVYFSAKTWIKTEISVIKIHENDNVNKTVLLLLCNSEEKKKRGGKTLYDLIDKEIE